jgi:hypothetical protein
MDTHDEYAETQPESAAPPPPRRRLILKRKRATAIAIPDEEQPVTPASTVADDADQATPATIPPPELPPLRLPAALNDAELEQWPFIPPCMSTAFAEEGRRLAMIKSTLGDHLSALESRIAALEPHTRTNSANHSLGVLRESVQEVRQLQIMLLDGKLDPLQRGLAQLARNYTTLQRKHWEYSRAMIGHFNQQYAFNPNRPGATLLKNPYISS